MVTVQWQIWWECSAYLGAATAILVAVAVGGAVAEGVGKRPSFFERSQPLEPHVAASKVLRR